MLFNAGDKLGGAMNKKGGERKRVDWFDRDPPTEIVHSAVARLIRRLPSRVRYDDLYSVGLMALVQAAQRFDASRGVTFRTYAKCRVQGAMLDELRRFDPASREQRLAIRRGLESSDAAPREVDISAAALVEDPVALPDEQLECRQDLHSMREMVRYLPERLQIIYGLRFQEGWLLGAIADRLNITAARVCQLCGEVMRRLSELMGAPQPTKVVIRRPRRSRILRPTLEEAIPPPRAMYA
ncbi:MAG: sigma-70 family RNA polymerase sigma factor [Candidatus Uhrbacteria bacterium]|nr:sigma-70 family RNA polymerase sigma factor [Candidatus Uhrbacteria bacterium]